MSTTGNNNLPSFVPISEATLQASISVSTTTQDIVSIAVAEAEHRIIDHISTLNARLHEARAAHDRNREALDNYLDNLPHTLLCPNGYDSPLIDEIRSVSRRLITTLGGNGDMLRFSISKPSFCDHTRTISFRVSASWNSGGSLSFSAERLFSIDAPPRYFELSEALDQSAQTISSLQNSIAEARLALSNLPVLERRARAAVTSSLLSRTEDGNAIIQTIRSLVPSNDRIIESLRF